MIHEEKLNGFDSFAAFIKEFKDQAKDKSTADYYHVNVVIEAYQRGIEVGKEKGFEEYLVEIQYKQIELFQAKANQIYILSKKLIEDIQALGDKRCSLHINITQKMPTVIVAVSNECLLDDLFIESIYNKLDSYRKMYFSLFDEKLDIGLMPIENVNLNQLKDEGFSYYESFD